MVRRSTTATPRPARRTPPPGAGSPGSARWRAGAARSRSSRRGRTPALRRCTHSVPSSGTPRTRGPRRSRPRRTPRGARSTEPRGRRARLTSRIWSCSWWAPRASTPRRPAWPGPRRPPPRPPCRRARISSTRPALGVEHLVPDPAYSSLGDSCPSVVPSRSQAAKLRCVDALRDQLSRPRRAGRRTPSGPAPASPPGRPAAAGSPGPARRPSGPASGTRSRRATEGSERPCSSSVPATVGERDEQQHLAVRGVGRDDERRRERHDAAHTRPADQGVYRPRRLATPVVPSGPGRTSA